MDKEYKMKAKCKYYITSEYSKYKSCTSKNCPNWNSETPIKFFCQEGIIYFNWLDYIFYDCLNLFFDFEDIIYDE